MADVFFTGDTVSVSIARETIFAERANFSIINIVTTEGDIDQRERARLYSTLTDVAVDYASTDEAYLAASAIFSKNPRPEQVMISRRFTADQAGFMRGAAITADLATFVAVTDGSFEVSVDGVSQDVTLIDFTGDTSFADVATSINVALTGAVCTYDSTYGAFVITSSTTGASSAITAAAAVAPAAGTDISGAGFLNMLTDVAYLVPGLALGTIIDELDEIESLAPAFFYFIGFTKEVRDAFDDGNSKGVVDIAAWAETKVKQYFTVSNNSNALLAADTASIPYLLNAGAYARTFCVYSSTAAQYPEFPAAAEAATTNFDGIKSTKTLKFKKAPGITAETPQSVPSFTGTGLTRLRAIECNVFTSEHGIGMYKEGTMSNGEFQDIVHFADWLANAIELNVFNQLQVASTKVPYNEEGLDSIQGRISQALEQGVRNGGLSIFDEEINGKVVQQPAYTISRVPVKDVAQSTRAARSYNGFSFTGRLAGAVHFTTISGTLSV